MKKVILLGCFFLTACASSMNQDFMMSGNEAGIRAFNDGISGIARTSKESADQSSEYFAHRGKEEIQATERVKALSFWGKLAQ